MKSKLQLFFASLILSNLTLMVLLAFTPQALAQVTAPPANNNAIVNYSGPEDSIKRLLCTPGISDTGTPTNDQTQGKILNANVPGTTTATSNPTAGDLSLCVNRLYRFGAAIGAFAAVFFVALAGYYYILGGEHAKEKAKHMIISVIVGLLIIFTSYILLKFINPEAVKFKSIQPPELGNVAALPDCAGLGLPEGCSLSARSNPENYQNGTVGGAAANSHPEASCSTHSCPTLVGTGVNCATTGCKVQPNLLTKLEQLNALMKNAGIAWHVGQAFPPSGTHESSCHNVTGSCVDVSPDSKTADNFAKMCLYVKQVGLTLLNEAIVTQGTSAESACGNYVKTKDAAATVANSHLHVGLP